MMFKSPFGPSTSQPGTGHIAVSLVPPSTTPTLSTLTYQYPLKLVAPTNIPTTSTGVASLLIFLLTYGGGLVAGDTITLTITLAPSTRLTLLTQGSTKIFKTPRPSLVTRQNLDVDIGQDAALCYLPDPTQPFAKSAFEQKQIFRIPEAGDNGSSLCVLDWVSEGRRARGEKWEFHTWKGRNEVRSSEDDRLLLRDAVVLDSNNEDVNSSTPSLADKTANLGVLGTLILHGPVFASLADTIMDDFATQPRIGGRNWQSHSTQPTHQETPTPLETSRARRRDQAAADGVLWTAARVRGFVLVKFGAVEVEGARRWLRDLLVEEGSVVRGFGEEALLCLR